MPKVLVGKPDPVDTWTLGQLPQALPAQQYHLADDWPAAMATKLWLGWRLGEYRFAKYKRQDSPPGAALMKPEGADRAYVESAIAGTFLTPRPGQYLPAGDMGPEQLEAAAQTLADAHAADLTVIRGDDLLQQDYPLVHRGGSSLCPAAPTD